MTNVLARIAYTLWNRTLNNVLFGVSLMVLIAIYIAIGSGRPQVREYFEMDELKFFAAWPLIVLMVLLVASLTTVTLTRIPFTPPRYGVWCVHTGIVVLIYGMFLYYSQKVEGQILVPAKQSAEHFYDRWERALYARAGERRALPVRLENLPRFDTYPAGSDRARRLDRGALRDVRPVFMVANRDGGTPLARSLGQELGLPEEPKISVIGYHPYAEVVTSFEEDDAGKGSVGIKLSLTGSNPGQTGEEWLVAGDAESASSNVFNTTFEHLHVATAEEAKKIADSAGKLHRLDVLVGQAGHTLYVEPGKSYKVGETGYEITVENYLPNWRTMQGETVDLLTFMVKTPTAQFRRQVIPGRANPTDWQLDDPSAGPMGKRQEKPLDEVFRTLYTFEDPAGLLGKAGIVKHTLITSGDAPGITEVIVGRERAAEVRAYAEGKGEIEIPQMPTRGPFQPKLTPEEIAALPKIKIAFERRDNVRRSDRVIDVPKAKRDRDEGAAGVRQVVTVRITSGNHDRVVHVPFSQWTAEPFMPWKGQEIWLPGATRPLQLQLGNSLVGMPARVTLEQFELVPYPGGSKQAGLMRDFKSTLRVHDLDTGSEFVGVAHMNSPVYFERQRPFYMPDESWLFFQSGWNQQAGESLTILGVGNRPGVVTMTVGSIMIGVGLLYAFYVKPIIIARNKRRALEAHAGPRSPAPPPRPAREPVHAGA